MRRTAPRIAGEPAPAARTIPARSATCGRSAPHGRASSAASRPAPAACYSIASSETGGDDPSIGALGANLGFAGFTVGGSIAIASGTDEIGYNGYLVDEATVFDLGVTYGFENATVGIGWSHGEYEDSVDGEEDTLDYVNLGASYTLGPGVLLAAFIGVFSYEDGGPTSNDNGGWQTGVGASLDF